MGIVIISMEYPFGEAFLEAAVESKKLQGSHDSAPLHYKVRAIHAIICGEDLAMAVDAPMPVCKKNMENS